MAVKFTNNAATTLAAGINSSVTSISVTDGSVFPALTGSDHFYVTFDDTTNREIVKVTARSGNTLTVVRGQDNTTAQAFNSGDKAELRVVAALLEDITTEVTSTLSVDTFTGDGTTTAFTLSQAPSSEDNLIVFIEGAYQNPGDFVLSGTTLTLDEAPVVDRNIIVYHVKGAVSGNNLNQDSFTADGNTAAFTLSIAPIHENNTQVFIDGVYQQKNSYSVSGTTLTLDANPSNGATVEVMTFTQTDVNTLPASFVSGLTEVTAVGADHFMIFDATDSALKKSLVSDVLESATSISTSADATAITIDSSENVTFTNNVTINSGQLTAGGLAYPTSDGTNGQVLTTDGAGTLSFSTISGYTDSDVETYLNTSEIYTDATNNRLGIGTSSPSQKLQVEDGNIYIRGVTEGEGLLIQDSTASTGTYSITREGSGSTGYLKFGTPTDETHSFVFDGGNVGIGVSPPSSAQLFDYLFVSGIGVAGISTEGGLYNNAYYNGTAYKRTNTGYASRIYMASDSSLLYEQASSNSAETDVTFNTALKIDSSGNLLVGKTALDNSTVGIRMNSTGDASFVKDGSRALVLNRKTSDGDIAIFLKDNSTVGSIGVDFSDNLFISGKSDHAGLMFSNIEMYPYKNGTFVDATLDIGASSGRWRNLYLSGGAYLGGTSAANKLDDYEEGTWRPTVAGATSAGSYVYGENAGVYTKIGNQVTCSFYILQLGANVEGSGALIINNLPFTVASITAGTVLDYYTGNVTFENFDIHTNAVNLASHAIAGTTHITFFETKDASLDGTVVTTDRVDGNADIIGQITYRTT